MVALNAYTRDLLRTCIHVDILKKKHPKAMSENRFRI